MKNLSLQSSITSMNLVQSQLTEQKIARHTITKSEIILKSFQQCSTSQNEINEKLMYPVKNEQK